MIIMIDFQCDTFLVIIVNQNKIIVIIVLVVLEELDGFDLAILELQ